MTPDSDGAQINADPQVAVIGGALSDERQAQLRAAGLEVGGDVSARAVCVLAADTREGVRDFLEARPDARVIAVTDADEPDRVTAAGLLRGGARGVCARSADAAVLVAAIRAVGAGLVVVPSTTRDALQRPVFTTRQRQVVSLLVLGMSNAEIATRLYLSESTVKMHLSAVYDILNVRSRKEVVDVILTHDAGTEILRPVPAPRRPGSGYEPPSVR